MNNLSLQMAEQFFKALQLFAASLEDEKAMEVAYVYDPWTAGKTYAVGEFLTYGKNNVGDPQLYKVVLDHTSQADWTPDIATSLYDAIGLDENGYPVWSQPTGAHDAYSKGDIVNYNDKLYESLINGNIYSPDVYSEGWKVYGDSEEDENIPDVVTPEVAPDEEPEGELPEENTEYPIWSQPTGAHDAYNKGDIVIYNDKLYESLMDGNIYAPDVYPAGWAEYVETINEEEE